MKHFAIIIIIIYKVDTIMRSIYAEKLEILFIILGMLTPFGEKRKKSIVNY